MWLLLSSGMGGTGFVIMVSVINGKKQRGRWQDRSPGAVGEACVLPSREKKARFVIDLTTGKAVPEAAFGRR
jgi:hypothetical protein